MPPIRTSRTKKPPPAGFSEIEDTLLTYSARLKDAQQSDPSSSGLKKHESLWPIFQITHTRSRYIYELYYERDAITKELYDWLCKNGYVDVALVAKWKKMGYEKLCCLRCVAGKETNFGGTCVCRVPKAVLSKRSRKKGGGGGGDDTREGDDGGEEEERDVSSVQCVNCGCRGCASSD